MSDAVRVGDTIYVSGQVATDPDGRVVGAGDAAAQARECFRKVDRILRQLGADLGDVVSVTTYLANEGDARSFLSVRAQTFPADPPATTTVIARPILPDLLVEVQVIAVLAGSR
jgi:enamine deaminase RidA (YjgF/YER057c/UK114 family)